MIIKASTLKDWSSAVAQLFEIFLVSSIVPQSIVLKLASKGGMRAAVIWVW